MSGWKGIIWGIWLVLWHTLSIKLISSGLKDWYVKIKTIKKENIGRYLYIWEWEYL